MVYRPIDYLLAFVFGSPAAGGEIQEFLDSPQAWLNKKLAQFLKFLEDVYEEQLVHFDKWLEDGLCYCETTRT